MLFFSTRRLQYWHPCWNFPAEIVKVLLKVRNQYQESSQSNWKTTFLNCSSVNVVHFLTTLPEVSRSKCKQNNKNESFLEKITSLKVLVWKGTQQFDKLSGKCLVEKWQIFSPTFLKKGVLDELKKINFTSKCPWTRTMHFGQPSGNFYQKFEKPSLKAR